MEPSAYGDMPDLPPAVKASMDLQLKQLGAALIETQAIARAQGHGVTVTWTRTADPEMRVEMTVDPEVAVGHVQYRNLDFRASPGQS